MIECIQFRHFPSGALVGFADLYVPKWDVEIRDCCFFEKEGKRWVSFPGKEYTSQEGLRRTKAFMKFREHNHFLEFCTQAKEAVQSFLESQSSKEQQDRPNVDTPF